MLGLHGAEIVFVPSATTTGHSDNLWKIEQTSMAIANGYFVGTNNRVGREAPWNFGEFYGCSYFCNPYGEILAQGSRDKDELVVADLDLDLIDEGARALAVLPRPAAGVVRRHRRTTSSRWHASTVS